MKMYSRQGPGPVNRIRIKRESGKWKVIKKVRVDEMTLPPSSELPDKADYLSGFWFEGVDKKGKALYRQLLREPIRGVEIYEDNGKITRVSADREEYIIDLLIPDIPDIVNIHLFLEETELLSKKNKAVKKEQIKPVAVFPVSDKDKKEGR